MTGNSQAVGGEEWTWLETATQWVVWSGHDWKQLESGW